MLMTATWADGVGRLARSFSCGSMRQRIAIGLTWVAAPAGSRADSHTVHAREDHRYRSIAVPGGVREAYDDGVAGRFSHRYRDRSAVRNRGIRRGGFRLGHPLHRGPVEGIPRDASRDHARRHRRRLYLAQESDDNRRSLWSTGTRGNRNCRRRDDIADGIRGDARRSARRPHRGGLWGYRDHHDRSEPNLPRFRRLLDVANEHLPASGCQVRGGAERSRPRTVARQLAHCAAGRRRWERHVFLPRHGIQGAQAARSVSAYCPKTGSTPNGPARSSMNSASDRLSPCRRSRIPCSSSWSRSPAGSTSSSAMSTTVFKRRTVCSVNNSEPGRRPQTLRLTAIFLDLGRMTPREWPRADEVRSDRVPS